MKLTPRKVNLFNLVKLPLAYLGGVRVRSITDTEVVVTIKHRWMNQNPFNSMFWAAQGMAAEMPTGVLVMKAINDSKRKVSMLVTNQEAQFYKKATGRINFICKDGLLVEEAIKKTIASGESETITMTAEGFDAENESVSKFEYTWWLKVKS